MSILELWWKLKVLELKLAFVGFCVLLLLFGAYYWLLERKK
jgi:hypothetical protein